MCLIVLTWEQVRKGAEDKLKKATKNLAEAQVELLAALSDIEMLKGNLTEKEDNASTEIYDTDSGTTTNNERRAFINSNDRVYLDSGGTGTWPGKDGVTVVYGDELSQVGWGE